MKTSYYFCLSILLVMTSCQTKSSRCDEVICETVHRYGVPLDPQDWTARGQDGQVVSMRKDGVTVTRTYDAGVLHGECTYTFPHRNVIQKKEIYDQGTLKQEIDHYAGGLPQRQMTYETPARQTTIIWYENGAPQCREEYENSHLVQGEYYNHQSQVESRIEDSNGWRTCRNGLGQLQSMDTIQNGQMLLRTTYHPNGTPAQLTPYVNAVIEGQRRTFLAGGEPATVEEWKDNVQHGTTTVFEHGEKWAEVPYVNGSRHGIERRYREEQTVAQEIPWIQGQRHGPCYTYINDSTQEDWYFRDRKVPNQATYEMLSNQ